MKSLITFSDLVGVCDYLGAETEDWYLCQHPECVADAGACDEYKCPLASPATMADLRALDANLFEQYRAEFPNDDDRPAGGETWLVQEKPEKHDEDHTAPAPDVVE